MTCVSYIKDHPMSQTCAWALCRYRVVPSCYRRAMPVHLKSHRSHDVVLLCVTCHEVAHGVSACVCVLVGWLGVWGVIGGPSACEAVRTCK